MEHPVTGNDFDEFNKMAVSQQWRGGVSVNLHDREYLHHLNLALNLGTPVPTRAILRSTGQKVGATAIPVASMIFPVMSQRNDWAEYDSMVPLLTTTDMRKSFNDIVHELLWFISGSTNVRPLQEQGVHIWDQWAGPDGELGPVYGAAWRRYEGKENTVDQLAAVIEGLRAVKRDPAASVARRLIVNSWDPTRLHEMMLPPCHMMFQFLPIGEMLHIAVTQRSGDAFLGVPYNMASYGLLLTLVAEITGFRSGNVYHTVNNFHIYDNHRLGALRQVERVGHGVPHVRIQKRKEIDDFRFGDFELRNYQCDGPIRGEVAV